VLEVPGAAAGDHDHDHDHDHGHDHDHDHEHEEGHQHADWTARYRFRCANPAALRNIDTGLFAQFPSLQSVSVQLIDARGARGETLTPDARRIALAP
jgi:ABC-type Zn2+ transport system substrate-binding protein/surface adhesin